MAVSFWDFLKVVAKFFIHRFQLLFSFLWVSLFLQYLVEVSSFFLLYILLVILSPCLTFCYIPALSSSSFSVWLPLFLVLFLIFSAIRWDVGCLLPVLLLWFPSGNLGSVFSGNCFSMMSANISTVVLCFSPFLLSSGDHAFASLLFLISLMIFQCVLPCTYIKRAKLVASDIFDLQ